MTTSETKHVWCEPTHEKAETLLALLTRHGIPATLGASPCPNHIGIHVAEEFASEAAELCEGEHGRPDNRRRPMREVFEDENNEDETTESETAPAPHGWGEVEA